MPLREQIVRESGIDEEEGIFSMEAPPDHVAAALFRFGQALTKIHDLTFLSRDRVASTFYDDLRGLLWVTAAVDRASETREDGRRCKVEPHRIA